VLPPLARRLVEAVDGEAHVVYGSTEAEPISGTPARTLVDPGETGEEGLCVGRPIERIDVRILRAHDGPIVAGGPGLHDLEVAPGETGEIVVAGAHVLTGYLNDPEADRENKIRDGTRVWHRTGDAGRLGADGRLWLMGRVKHRVRRKGRTWWPLPAEVRALRAEGTAHAAYFGLPVDAAEQEALLVVEPARGSVPPDATELEQVLAPWPVDRVHVVPHIPRDPRHRSKTDHEAMLRQIAAESRDEIRSRRG